MANEPDDQQNNPPDAARLPRQPYSPPRLVEYGSIAKLTQSQGSTLPEGGRPNMQPCL
ncbi:MAG TPA: lasso RiPP family leader peptide-containing protein [Vicinamibacterales bacterium]|jgi:hypothetical protein